MPAKKKDEVEEEAPVVFAGGNSVILSLTQPLDALPVGRTQADRLKAAQEEHAQIMQMLAQANEFCRIAPRRGIFLEGVIATLTPQPNRAERRRR